MISKPSADHDKDFYKNQLAQERIRHKQLILECENRGNEIAEQLKIEIEKNNELNETIGLLTSEENMEEALQKQTELLEMLSKSQISTDKTKVLNLCSKLIIHFKADNVRNFLNSVKSVLGEVEEENHSNMLCYAKTRVGSNITIANTEYDNFDDFEQDVLRQFKPAQDHLQLNQEIMMLNQAGSTVAEHPNSK